MMAHVQGSRRFYLSSGDGAAIARFMINRPVLAQSAAHVDRSDDVPQRHLEHNQLQHEGKSLAAYQCEHGH